MNKFMAKSVVVVNAGGGMEPRGERWANPKQWNAAGGLSELIFHVAGCTMGQRSYMIITRGIRYCV